MTPLWLERLTSSLQQSKNQSESRFLQLATVDSLGHPANRTVVFRGLDDDDMSLIFISDLRSEKIAHLKETPIAECCWYFTRTREQYRLRVGCTIITPECDRLGVCQYSWDQLSDSAKAQFLWGEPKTSRDASQTLKPNGALEDMPTHFCVIKAKVEHVDYLNLLANPQSRELHFVDDSGNWATENVIP